ncbi:MAG: hypothetical protein MZV65_17615 [Chromatiales bacterium]|nr:hypothetical protein [Chromatiales bacterium]
MHADDSRSFGETRAGDRPGDAWSTRRRSFRTSSASNGMIAEETRAYRTDGARCRPLSHRSRRVR